MLQERPGRRGMSSQVPIDATTVIVVTGVVIRPVLVFNAALRTGTSVVKVSFLFLPGSTIVSVSFSVSKFTVVFLVRGDNDRYLTVSLVRHRWGIDFGNFLVVVFLVPLK